MSIHGRSRDQDIDFLCSMFRHCEESVISAVYVQCAAQGCKDVLDTVIEQLRDMHSTPISTPQSYSPMSVDDMSPLHEAPDDLSSDAAPAELCKVLQEQFPHVDLEVITTVCEHYDGDLLKVAELLSSLNAEASLCAPENKVVLAGQGQVPGQQSMENNSTPGSELDEDMKLAIKLQEEDNDNVLKCGIPSLLAEPVAVWKDFSERSKHSMLKEEFHTAGDDAVKAALLVAQGDVTSARLVLETNGFKRDPPPEPKRSTISNPTGATSKRAASELMNELPLAKYKKRASQANSESQNFHNEANFHGQAMKDYKQLAKEARLKNDHESANKYQETAREHEKLMHENRFQAGKCAFVERNGHVNNTIIDLHGQTVADALTQVQNTLDGLAMVPGNHCVKFITGKGLHSTGGVPKIFPKVKEFLEKHKFDLKVCEGSIYVNLKTPPNVVNNGASSSS